MIYGIDISNWQEGLDVKSLPSDVSFVICKVSEGTSFTDWTCKKFIHDAIDSGRQFGFYHFARGFNPEMEAEWFVENARDYFGYGIPVLDYEIDARYGNLSESEWCEIFVERVHQLTGCWCMFYTYASKLSAIGNTWLPGKCPLWLAGYPSNADSFSKMYPPYDTTPWHYAVIWQFTSSLTLPGVPFNLDGNIAYINESDWKNYYGREEDMPTSEEIAEHVWGYNYKNTIRGGNTIYDEVAAIYDMVLELVEEVEDLKKVVEDGKH